MGLFRRSALVIASAVLAAVFWFATRGRAAAAEAASRAAAAIPPAAPPPGRLATRLSVAGAAAVVAAWTGRTVTSLGHGVASVDSLQHHLPFAARFAQEGWLTRLHFAWLDPVWSYYPSNSELFHGVAMLSLGRDVLSPLLNLGWLALALLAGWCVGRPWGVGPVTLTGVAIVTALPVMSLTQAGSAGNDIPVLALWVACLALLVQVPLTERAPLLFAGLAGGLALASKLTVLAPLGLLTVVLLIAAPKGSRGRVLAWWAVPLAVASAFWFLRNLVRAGNPIPALDVPGLPSIRFPAVEAYGFSVADYLGDGRFWNTVVPNGLREAFGLGVLAIVLLAALGLVLAAIRGPGRFVKGLGVVGIASVLAYVVTPLTAYGPEGNLYLFGANTRYLTPALAAGLVLLPLVMPVLRVRRFGRPLAAYLLVLGATLFGGTGVWRSWSGQHRRAAVAAGVLTVVVLAWMPRLRRMSGRRLALVVVVLAAAVVAAGLRVERHFEAGRYADDRLAGWADSVHGARIGFVGVAEHYPLYGLHLSNRVEYVGQRGLHGAFSSIRTCEAFRAAVASGGYDFVVTGPEKWQLEPAPESGWMRSDPRATLVLEAGRRLVFRRAPGPASGPCP